MVQTVCVVVKSPTASIRTNERLLSSMDSLMDLEIRFVFENLPATRVRALMRHLSFVCPHVIFELSLVREKPLTTTVWARDGSASLEVFLFC